MLWFWVFAAIVILFGFVVFRGAPYVPSHRRFAELAFAKLYELKEDDVLVDLGSGDGVILRLATKKGAHAIGYELNPALVLISRMLAWGDKKQTIQLADMWLNEFPAETTIVYAFVVSRDTKKLRKRLQDHVDKFDKSLWCMTYGAQMEGKEPVRTLNAHSLYVFEPATLHEKQA